MVKKNMLKSHQKQAQITRSSISVKIRWTPLFACCFSTDFFMIAAPFSYYALYVICMVFL